MPKPIRDPIPAGPFQRWLNDYIARIDALEGEGQGCQRVLREVGWWDRYKDHGERKLYRIRYGIGDSVKGRRNGPPGVRRKGTPVRTVLTVYSRAMVEDCLHHAGVAFADVYPPEMYPALHEDIPLEPEAWCANCQDTCTPIHGICPWCDGGLLVPVAAPMDELRKAA